MQTLPNYRTKAEMSETRFVQVYEMKKKQRKFEIICGRIHFKIFSFLLLK